MIALALENPINRILLDRLPALDLLRNNPLNHPPEMFRAKAESYRARWPWLAIVE
ncbi:hypothetical protein [Pseudomonas sichuanensis]|uniref:hypothetical protein n=1 Tax=Pseudomonas sichuanensis TaxID=2213015 RepID=UPI00130038FE|nr:hypothetical protein [Pseudomonas sichuanensis]